MTDPLAIVIPSPPSVNGMFRNLPGKGRVKTTRYRTWARAAANALVYQIRRTVSGPVVVDITCRRKSSREDVDNKIKAVLDFLVDQNLIDDDSKVQEVRCRWGDVPGAVVTIIPYVEKAA